MKRSLSVQMGLFVAVRTLINVAVRMAYPFLGVFQRGLGVDLSLLSTGLSLRSASGIFGPFLASVADSRGRRSGMLFGASLFTLGVGLVVAWPSYPAFVAMLSLTIVGNFVFIPSMQAFLGDRVPYRRRGTVLALTEFSWSLSYIIGVPLVGVLIKRWGWQAPFPLLALLGLMSLGGLASLLPGEPREPEPAVPAPPSAGPIPAQPGASLIAGGTGSRPGPLRNLAQVFTNSQAIAGLVLGLALGASNELVSVTFGVWLEDSFKVKIAALSAAAVIIGTSELGAEALVSGLVDRLGKSRAFKVGMALNTLAVLSLPFLGSSVTPGAGLAPWPGLAGALTGLFLLYITFEFSLVSSIPLMTEVLPTVRATFMASYLASLSMGRALADLVALRFYSAGQTLATAAVPTMAGISPGKAGIWSQATLGMFGVAVAAAATNLIALMAIRVIRVDSNPPLPPKM